MIPPQRPSLTAAAIAATINLHARKHTDTALCFRREAEDDGDLRIAHAWWCLATLWVEVQRHLRLPSQRRA